ncbi:MAG: hypothetical protein GXP37_12055 [Chloroflexi bacterium]|nr:hypothetical protein [Chloroflexota bacterium]
MRTRRFNRGYALIFLLALLIALTAIYETHKRIDGRYQAQTAAWADYTLDDWLTVLHLDEVLGEPSVTPVPAEQLFSTPTSNGG